MYVEFVDLVLKCQWQKIRMFVCLYCLFQYKGYWKDIKEINKFWRVWGYEKSMIFYLYFFNIIQFLRKVNI